MQVAGGRTEATVEQRGRIRMPAFRQLAPEVANDVRAALEPLNLRRGHTIFNEGDSASGVYFVVTGKVKLSRSRLPGDRAPAGRGESLLRLLGPGTMFGELSCLDNGRRSSTATTVTSSELAHLPRHDLQRLLDQHPEIASALLLHLTHRLRWADVVMAGLALNDVTGRVAATLVYLAETLGEPNADGLVIAHDLTQAELAAMVGATRETVNRTLTELAGRGLIENGFRKVKILQLDKLQQRIA